MNVPIFCECVVLRAMIMIIDISLPLHTCLAQPMNASLSRRASIPSATRHRPVRPINRLRFCVVQYPVCCIVNAPRDYTDNTLHCITLYHNVFCNFVHTLNTRVTYIVIVVYFCLDINKRWFDQRAYISIDIVTYVIVNGVYFIIMNCKTYWEDITFPKKLFSLFAVPFKTVCDICINC